MKRLLLLVLVSIFCFSCATANKLEVAEEQLRVQRRDNSVRQFWNVQKHLLEKTFFIALQMETKAELVSTHFMYNENILIMEVLVSVKDQGEYKEAGYMITISFKDGDRWQAKTGAWKHTFEESPEEE
jgi:hypothetical protein